MKWVMVGGKFDDNGGKASGYIQKLCDAFSDSFPYPGHLFNGGTFTYLTQLMETLPNYGIIIWIPDIPNSKQKQVDRIKELCPHSILVISKNNRDGGHDIYDLLARSLQAKANLLIEFTGKEAIQASVLDPLGNCFAQSENVGHIGMALGKRLFELIGFTRMGSRQMPGGYTPEDDPPILGFIKAVRGHARTFHDLIHGHNKDRFLGNCSFRCTHGFPSFRGDKDMVWISRRNMDKRDMGVTAFVPCKLVDGSVCYWGSAKPSVDAPIQLMLYKYFKGINFMLHSHVYLEASYYNTNRVIPCGALEEFYEIVSHVRDRGTTLEKINLKGHGSLIMSADVQGIINLKYRAREIPERF